MTSSNTIQLKLALSGLEMVQSQLKGLTSGLASSLKAFKALAVVGALVGATTALEHFTKEAIDAADEAGKMAQKVGIAVEKLTALQYAAKLSDIGVGELQFAIKNLSQDMQKAGRGSEDVTDELLRLADVFAKSKDGAEKTAFAVDKFGRSGIDMIPLLNQGSHAIRELMKEAETFGAVIGGETAKSAEEFNDNLTRMKTAFHGVFNVVAQQLLPTLVHLSEVIVSMIKESNALLTFSLSLVEVYKTLATAITYVGAGFESMIAFASTFNEVFDDTLSFTKAWAAAVDALGPISYKYAVQLQAIANIGEEVADSTKKQVVEGEKLIIMATREATLLSMIKDAKSSMDSLDARFDLSKKERYRKTRGHLENEIALRQKLISAVPMDLASHTNERGELIKSEEQIKNAAKLNGLLKEQTDAQVQLHKLDSENTFSGRMEENLTKMQDQAEAVGRNIADIFANTIGTAIDSISQGLTEVIMGAKTLGQAMQQIGRTILTEIIGSIIKMGVQWIFTNIIMAASGRATAAGVLAMTLPLAAAQTAIWAGPAAVATIASYGGAAAVAPAAITASIAMSKAAILMSAGFASGGYTGNGPKFEVAGQVHRGEFVMPAHATSRIGVGNLESMMNGGSPAASESGPVNVTNITLRDHAELREFIKSRAGRDEIINIVRGSKREIGI